MDLDAGKSVKYWKDYLLGTFSGYRVDFSGTSDVFRAEVMGQFDTIIAPFGLGEDYHDETGRFILDLTRTCDDIASGTIGRLESLGALANSASGLICEVSRRFDASFSDWPEIRVSRLHEWKSRYIRGFFDVTFEKYGLVMCGFQLLWQNGRWTVGLPGYYHPTSKEWKGVVHVSYGVDSSWRKAEWLEYLTRAAVEYCVHWGFDLEALKKSKEEEVDGDEKEED